MNDQTWAIIAGGCLIIAMRIIDFFLPKGRAWKWMFDHTVDPDGDDDRKEA